MQELYDDDDDATINGHFYGLNSSSCLFCISLFVDRLALLYDFGPSIANYKPRGLSTPSAGIAGWPKLAMHSFFQSLGVKLSAASLKAAKVQKLSSPTRWFPGSLQKGMVTGLSL